MFLFLDTETHAESDQIMIQLAYRSSQTGASLDALYSTGGVPIDLKAMAVHHIEEPDIADKPYFNDTSDKPELEKLLADHALVAHNANFDTQVLNNHQVEVPSQICTLRVARYLYPEAEQHKLQYLRYFLWLTFDPRPTAHDAMGDVIVLEWVFWKLFETLKTRANLETDEQVRDRMIQISSEPSILYMCRFGKHKGTLWSEVPKQYLNWVVNISDFTDEDVLWTAKYYLEKED